MLKRGNLFSLLCLLALAALVTINACKKNEEVTALPVGTLLEYGECKNFSQSANLNSTFSDQGTGCIQYNYNGDGTLTLKHVNAGFNCCPGQVFGDIEISGTTITITEREQEAGCHCLCLFDLDFQILNLQPGVYTVRIEEPYLDDNDEELHFSLDLSAATTGEYCLARTSYPWGQ